MLYSVGVGPLLSEEGKTYVRAIAEQASIITVRDKELEEQLIALNIPADRIVVSADPAFRLRVPQSPMDTNDIYTSGEFQLGVALRNWDVGIKPDYWEANVADAIDRFLDNYPNASVKFVPFQDLQEQLLDDHVISTRVQHLLRNSNRTKVINGTSTYFECAINLAQCDIVLGMRLHSLILAIGSGIPVIGLIYDPKVKNLMSQVGIAKYAIDLNEATGAVITKSIEEVIQNKSMLSAKLRDTSSNLAKVAFMNAHVVIELLAKTVDQPPAFSLATEEIYKSSMLSLVESLETRTKMLKGVLDQVERYELATAELHLRKNELDAQVSNLEKKLIILESELETTSIHNHELIKNNSDYQTRLSEVAQEYDNLKTLFDEQIYKYDLWMDDRKKMELEINKLQKNKTRLNNTISKLADKNNKLIAELISEQNTEKREYSQQIDTLEQQSSGMQIEVTRLSNELETIKKSRGWKLLWEMWQLRLFLIPHSSRRERVIGKLYRNTRSLLSSPLHYGKSIVSRILK